MALRLQSEHGRITANGVRHVRQAVITGEHVQRADVLAIINELHEAQRELDRVQGVLRTLERDHAENMAGAWSDGWMAGTDAMVRGRSPEERILALVEVAGTESNPYAALLDAPIVEDLPEPIGGEH